MSATSEATGAAYLARVLDGIYEAPKPQQLPVRALEIDVDLGKSFTATVVFTMEGESHTASETSPGESPQPHILSCQIGCGAWQTEASFYALAADVRDLILDECREEASWS